MLKAHAPRGRWRLAYTLVADFDVVDLLTCLTDPCVDVLDVAAGGVMGAAPESWLQSSTSTRTAGGPGWDHTIRMHASLVRIMPLVGSSLAASPRHP